MAWRGLLWWCALLANAVLLLLLAASAGALYWNEPDQRSQAVIVFALLPAPVLALIALVVFRRPASERLDASVFS